jgi:membrane protein YqaA with SNARE-associated domain
VTPEQTYLRGAPTVGLGQVEAVVAPIAAHSPWGVAIATSVVGAFTGWAIEEIATHVRGRRVRR